MYYTKYEYSIENNTSPFTAESAYYAYNSNLSTIDKMFDSSVNDHIKSLHGSNSTMSIVNSYMDTDFQISGFISSSNERSISNDYIDKMIIGNASDDGILAFASNLANNNKWQKIDCSYIAKCWKSGLVDLYIYLPTTYTYYVPHVQGASECDEYN